MSLYQFLSPQTTTEGSFIQEGRGGNVDHHCNITYCNDTYVSPITSTMSE